MPTAGTVQGLDLQISIEDSEPLIWRRVHLPETLTIGQFHLAVQAAFGWENRHLYGVRGTDSAGRERRIVGIDDETEDLHAEPASSVVLSELLNPQKPGTSFDYDYDFGDSWIHRVELVGTAELQPGEMLCVEGARRGAIEDSGGPHGYRQLVEAVQDSSHPEHQEATSWA
ncbi:plasmid pRiA4b ORF-3 family protein [Arthrobacter sp. SLBN-122]|uniref:plasmid pRiA4b ORF-3 family protein n=1 Tax=Arthrobacter sp. SLBN-122 TaxID=2768455 RepID=UPI001150C174|nr:plasmid pRiA4b ORF-3 family protein [Arthrobacter sp. SLBN-122]